jgi:hypothetical protein
MHIDIGTNEMQRQNLEEGRKHSKEPNRVTSDQVEKFF